MISSSFLQVKRIVIVKLRVALELDNPLNPSMVGESKPKSYLNDGEHFAVSAAARTSKLIMATTKGVRALFFGRCHRFHCSQISLACQIKKPPFRTALLDWLIRRSPLRLRRGCARLRRGRRRDEPAAESRWRRQRAERGCGGRARRYRVARRSAKPCEPERR